MALLIQKTEIYDPKVLNCLCGGDTDHGSNNTDGFSGTASIKCKKCGLTMSESSYNIGYGDSLQSIYAKVVNRWNKTMGGK